MLFWRKKKFLFFVCLHEKGGGKDKKRNKRGSRGEKMNKSINEQVNTLEAHFSDEMY